MLNRDLRLYTVRVGSVGSFLAAAVDSVQARAIAEQWLAELEHAPRNPSITVKRSSDSRALLSFAK